MPRWAFAAVGLSFLGFASSANAVVFTFSGPSNASGDMLSATAEFIVTGTVLTIVLTNTQATAATDGADVLDGLFFDIAGSPTLSNGSVALSAGSTFVHRDNDPATGNDLNTEYMFESPVTGLSRTYGIGVTGFPNFNRNQDTFSEVFLGTEAEAGANSDYGLVPLAGINAGNFTNVYVNNSVTMTFNLSSSISESDISNVMVSYGSDGTTQLVPEPATLAALGLGSLALLRRRKRA